MFKTHHIHCDLIAAVSVEVELELDGLLVLVLAVPAALLRLLLADVRNVQPEVDVRVRVVDQHVAVQDLELEADVLLEELHLEQLLHRGPVVLLQLDAHRDDVLDLLVLDLLQTLRQHAL